MKYLISLAASALLASPALADERQPDEGVAGADAAITVLATGLGQSVDVSGQSISILSRPEILAIQGPDLTRVLERLPGVVFSRNGGPGGATGVRVRGAEAEQLLVLVDGIRMDDSSLPAGGPNFGNLLAGNVDKIELLRGSNSVIWGSQAIGGVMALTTRQLEGADLSAEYGAYESFAGTAALGGRIGSASGTIAAGYTRSTGYSEIAGDPEPDGYRQWELAGKGAVELGQGLAVNAAGRFADSRREIDGFGLTSADVQFTKDISARAGLSYAAGALELSAHGAIYDVRRDYVGPDLGGLYVRGRSYQAAFNGRLQLRPEVSLIFGASNDWTRFSDSATAGQSASQLGVHALLDYHAGRVNLSAGLRYDEHDTFGGAWTVGMNGSYEIVDGVRIRASYGEGFKTPTIYQLYAFADDYGFIFSGNPALQPERSRSYDAGIEYGTHDGTLQLGVTVFRRDSRNLITFVSCDTSSAGICADRGGDFMAGTYANIGRTRADGVEVDGTVRPSDRVQLHAAYSYVKSYNRTAGDFYEGRDLARRPRNALTVSADWRTPLRDLAIGADVRMVSDSFDNQFSSTTLDGYSIATVRATLPVMDRFEIFGRIENVTDERYQTAAGYTTAGRSAYIGARVRY
ncbi:MAG: TonB-dependent receptor [Pseudomonadota bacterium]